MSTSPEGFFICDCCSLQEKCVFFASWTLAHVLALLFRGLQEALALAPIKYESDTFIQFYSCIWINLMWVIHAIGAFFLFFGIYDNSALSFKLGIIISSIYPYLQFCFIYLPITQILFTLCACRYLKELEEIASN